jgi:hypothetical protein
MARIRRFMVDILLTAGFVVFFPVRRLLCVPVFVFEQRNAQQHEVVGNA